MVVFKTMQHLVMEILNIILPTSTIVSPAGLSVSISVVVSCLED